MSKIARLNYATLIGFFLYFIILIVERVLSVVQTFIHGVNILSNGFTMFVYLTIFASFAFFLIYLVTKCRKEMKYLFKPSNELENIDFRNLIIASGLILLSGMVHSEYTISGIQFAAYGVLIVGMIIYVINYLDSYKDQGLAIISLLYLICFSMAIPVSYPSTLQWHAAVHIVEGIGSYFLVAAFTCMFLMLFSKNIKGLLSPLFLALALAIDIPVIALEWQGNPNMFVMIFLIVSTVMYIVALGYQCVKAAKAKK